MLAATKAVEELMSTLLAGKPVAVHLLVDGQNTPRPFQKCLNNQGLPIADLMNVVAGKSHHVLVQNPKWRLTPYSYRPDRSGGDSNPGNNLHVSGLTNKCTDRDLEEAFGKYGTVSSKADRLGRRFN